MVIPFEIFFADDPAPRDTHKLEAILLSLTPFVFDRFLPSLTLWLSPNFPPRYARILAYGLPCPTLGRHPGAGPSLGGDVHDRRWLSINLLLPIVSQLVLQAGQVRHQVGPRFRRDSSGLVSVDPSARRFVIRMKTENQV